MEQAYVLVQTQVGRSAEVSAALAAISGVVLAEDVTGPYDVIARVEAATSGELGRLVQQKVQQVDGITRTVTCAVVA
ncbi:Lrp/AsnC ligand binding domain-containing protein [Pseudokineococcus lusitanus]|uniref:AsnC family transcriptional regulator n=1 Tax=Pseudokineococcus lusitanus TaxID=763993 RepID=A0A3N1HMT0_9ACTN|nr:Lrp/AsnC ligand binding domain-containing protein [Pseudokineococcus lusitanus]ROP43781.1 AsnC family transcriptional regulator [Pseudokineococcus lusitanus]